MSVSSRKSKTKLESKAIKIAQDLTDAENELKDKIKELKQAEKEVLKTTREFENAAKEEKKTKTNFDNFQKSKTDADDKVNSIQADLDKNKKKIGSTPSELNDIRDEKNKLETDLLKAKTDQIDINNTYNDLQTKFDDAKKNLASAKKAKDTDEDNKKKFELEKKKAEDAKDKAQKELDDLRAAGVAILDPSLALKGSKDPSFSDIRDKLKKNSSKPINDINKINNQTVKVPALYVLENKAHSNTDIEAFLSAVTRNTIKTPIQNGNIYYLPESLYNDLIKMMPNFDTRLKYIKPTDPSQYLTNITYQDILEAYNGNTVNIADSNKLTT